MECDLTEVEKLYNSSHSMKLCDFVIGLPDMTLEYMIGGWLWYIRVRLRAHPLASGISSQLLHL